MTQIQFCKSTYACLNYCTFFQWIGFDEINGGRTWQAVNWYMSITAPIDRRCSARCQRSKSVQNATNRWFGSVRDIFHQREALDKIWKTDAPSELRRIIKLRNNGKNNVLMRWTNETDVSSCVCVIVSVLHWRSQLMGWVGPSLPWF